MRFHTRERRMDIGQEFERIATGYATVAKSGIEAGERMGVIEGRAQAFREVEQWIARNADPATGMAHTETLMALCRGGK